MMRPLRVFGACAAALVAAVLVYTLLTLPPAPLALSPASWRLAGGRVVVRGAYHVHTTRSDGTGTPDAVAAAAARAGLQFVIFTDHGNAQRPPDAPVYRSGVLCLDAVEISADAGHYVALGLARAPYPLGGEGRDVIEDVSRMGGVGIVAHPTSAKASLRWREWTVPVQGIEWLNADSEWRDASALRLARELLDYLFRGPEAIVSVFVRPTAVLSRWDEMTRHARVVGLAASDAHGGLGLGRESDPSPGTLLSGLPAYQAVFRAFATRVEVDHPWSGSAPDDARQLLEAIRAGHTHAVIDALAGPASFEFLGQAGEALAFEGDVLPAGTPAVLRARVSRAPGAAIVLVGNGTVVAETGSDALAYRTDGRAGVYRVEVRLPKASVPWIVSNPIYIGRPLQPRPAANPPEVTRGAALETGAAPWHVENDPRSRGTIGGEAATAGQTAFRYELGGGIRAGQYAAIVRPVAGLSRYDRLSFVGRAERPMRLAVQVRKPGSLEGERWQRSIYLDEVAREVTVFLADLRPAGRTATPGADLAGINSLLLVVDTTNAQPGTAGTVWIERMRLEGK